MIVEHSFEVVVSEEKSVSGRRSCHIPEYDLYFSAKDEDVERVAKAMVKAFVKFHKEYCNQV